jgi:hypothetical protein
MQYFFIFDSFEVDKPLFDDYNILPTYINNSNFNLLINSEKFIWSDLKNISDENLITCFKNYEKIIISLKKNKKNFQIFLKNNFPKLSLNDIKMKVFYLSKNIIFSKNFSIFESFMSIKHQNLIKSLNFVSIDGLYLEFGVWKGRSINLLSKYINDKVIYGFDCFRGLPEDWNEFKIHSFSTSGVLPLVNKNVILIDGYFDDTLPKFIKKNNKPISFMHIDCDLYSSTKTIFQHLHNNLVHGSVIVFDEWYHKRHEYLAFNEYLKDYDRKAEIISLTSGQASFKII